mgnify:CR=1 FL=1
MRIPLPGKLPSLMILTLALSAAPPLAAHQGHRHEAKGTVQSSTAEMLNLKTVDGKEQSFAVTADTKCQRADAAARCSEIAAGERAVVTYETKEGANLALEVKLAKKQP